MYMRWCLELAETTARAGDTAVGALIVCGDDVVAEGVERTRTTPDPTAHAEVEAIREACQHLDTVDLRGCSLCITPTLASVYGRASSTILNGVAVARRKRVNPPWFTNRSRSRCSPA